MTNRKEPKLKIDLVSTSCLNIASFDHKKTTCSVCASFIHGADFDLNFCCDCKKNDYCVESCKNAVIPHFGSVLPYLKGH